MSESRITPLKVAKSIISQGNKKKINDISPLKLQKLLFLTYEKHKKLFNKKIFDSHFLVWKHGPVNLEVYNAYKIYGSNIIPQELDEPIENEEIKESIESVLDEYGKLAAWDLVDITHDEKGVWYKKMGEGKEFIEYGDI